MIQLKTSSEPPFGPSLSAMRPADELPSGRSRPRAVELLFDRSGCRELQKRLIAAGKPLPHDDCGEKGWARENSKGRYGDRPYETIVE